MVGNRHEVAMQLSQDLEAMAAMLKPKGEPTPEDLLLGEFAEKYIVKVRAGEQVDEEAFIENALPQDLRIPAREFLVILRLQHHLLLAHLQLFELLLKKIVRDYSTRLFFDSSDISAIEEMMDRGIGHKSDHR